MFAALYGSGFCLAAAVQSVLSGVLLLSHSARDVVDRPYLPLAAITATGAAIGVGAWGTWRTLVQGLASQADTDWPTKSSGDPADHHGGGVWTILAAAVIATVGGCVACCSLPPSDDDDAATPVVHTDELYYGVEEGSRGNKKNAAAADDDDDDHYYEYTLTGIDSSGGGESSSSPGSDANMLVSPGSPRQGSSKVVVLVFNYFTRIYSPRYHASYMIIALLPRTFTSIH